MVTVDLVLYGPQLVVWELTIEHFELMDVGGSGQYKQMFTGVLDFLHCTNISNRKWHTNYFDLKSTLV